MPSPSAQRQDPGPRRMPPRGAGFTPLPLAEGRWGGVELVDLAAAEWRGLCDQGPTDQPFYRPEWVGAYVRAFARSRRLLLVTVHAGGRLQAVLPLIEERRSFAGLPVRVLRSAANVHSSRFDLVRAGGPAGDAAVSAAWRFLRAGPRWDKLEFYYVPQGAALEGLLAEAARDGFPLEREDSWRTPYVPLLDPEGRPRPWFEETDARFRANLRRRRRQLEGEGPLKARHFSEADPDVLASLYAVEGAGWKGREGSAISCHPDTRGFYDEVAREAARFGYLSLYRLELGGRAVAAHFGLSHRGRYFLPKPAYDENYRRYSPGHLLMHEVLSDCARRGYRELDFLGAGADWKADWTSRVRPHNTWHLFHAGLRGRTLHAAQFRVKHALKALLRRSREER